MEPRARNTTLLVLAALALAALSYWLFQRYIRLPDLPDAPTGLTSVERPDPAKSRSPEVDMDAPAIDLPPLDASDEAVRGLIHGISEHPRLVAWLASDELVRRFVASVVNISRGKSPRAHLASLDPGGGFSAEERGGRSYISPRAEARYDAVAIAFSKLDTADLVRFYRAVEPLCREAWSELGEPGDFGESLHRAIDRLIAVPVPAEPLEVRRRVTSYVFVDPALESLSPAEKHLLRMGPENQRRVQEKLRALKTALSLTGS